MDNVKDIFTLDEIKLKANPVFQSYPSIDAVYLFGSYARSEATTRSDLDFMLVLKDDEIETLKDVLRVQSDLEDTFHINVDTLSSEEAYEIMPKSIERDKVLIYERKNKG